MPITLYYYPASPGPRLVLATAKAIGLDVDVRLVDLLAKEHLKEEYLKINPEHTIPTLDDNGFIIWDSHAIATYLVSQYGKDDSLYPKEPKKRARVDQRLYFEATTLFPRLKAITFPLLFLGKTEVEPDKKTALYDALGLLEKYLEPTGWVAGDGATIADIACAATASSILESGVDFTGFPRTRSWLERCSRDIPGFEAANAEGAKQVGQVISSRLPPNALAL
ncbi:glutathione S-transferase 1-like [Schistocerca cancellata]|uniref:glutathione S-transferase 1-like n=1 Tax=Schistocerca cancellata TaxID=274614 RepID=UPI002118A526|nr:glutathione S-transferase 1-like [Schistocerca cancellata]XP_049765491.1 glutathione S-transferase 1-like [Schistocerca cancellata]XP_049765492.1 glutathione S-transferase 1-like [Schistocerca cancellata]XP_049765493.1 glutathione S-transferase 1-like [Schistocerca cancellata]XP_049765494.1 glutathione S-transferase 1-like [Schistocerca cancellata]XP_049765495.1 glutathione S-transferase 1-like [Schistocerca cancellata]